MRRNGDDVRKSANPCPNYGAPTSSTTREGNPATGAETKWLMLCSSKQTFLCGGDAPEVQPVLPGLKLCGASAKGVPRLFD